jgi:hypothetical protein
LLIDAIGSAPAHAVWENFWDTYINPAWSSWLSEQGPTFLSKKKWNAWHIAAGCSSNSAAASSSSSAAAISSNKDAASEPARIVTNPNATDATDDPHADADGVQQIEVEEIMGMMQKKSVGTPSHEKSDAASSVEGSSDEESSSSDEESSSEEEASSDEEDIIPRLKFLRKAKTCFSSKSLLLGPTSFYRTI